MLLENDYHLYLPRFTNGVCWTKTFGTKKLLLVSGHRHFYGWPFSEFPFHRARLGADSI